MDTPEPEDRNSQSNKTQESSKGPSLVLVYSLIVLAILLAIFCAAMIVLPFYQRR
ncbi:MAG TPA: hypothetical protein VF730_18200 [Terracidiphilus sp.]